MLDARTASHGPGTAVGPGSKCEHRRPCAEMQDGHDFNCGLGLRLCLHDLPWCGDARLSATDWRRSLRGRQLFATTKMWLQVDWHSQSRKPSLTALLAWTTTSFLCHLSGPQRSSQLGLPTRTSFHLTPDSARRPSDVQSRLAILRFFGAKGVMCIQSHTL
jgi:hypothetical protein